MKSQERSRQGGAALILFALCLVVLFGFIGLVIDLGATYVGKTELQNAADASALAGAKRLNGTAAGVAAALQAAKDMSALNKYRFAKSPVAVTNDDVWIGSCPDDSCFTTLAASVATNATAAGKYFIKVDTRARNFDTTFMRVADIPTTAARGVAVAGRFFVPVAPIAICALNDADCPTGGSHCGFTPGVTYDVNAINTTLAPSGMGPGTQIWIDPVATNSSECIGNVSEIRPFMCEGKMNAPVEIGGTVYTNTGVSNALLASLDSRFGDYDSQGKCDPVTAPPDTNVMGYVGGQATDPVVKKLIQDGDVMADWYSIPNTQAAVRTSADGVKPVTVDTSTGVRESFYRPDGSTAPYRSTSGTYFRAPSNPGQGERRILNMVIVNCTTAGGNCRPLTVKMVGKFFMTRKANTNPGGVYVEYGGPVNLSSLASQEVKLFR